MSLSKRLNESEPSKATPSTLVMLTPQERENIRWYRAKLERELKARTEAQSKIEEAINDTDAVRERCKDFQTFVKEAWHVIEPGIPYKPNWHVDAIGYHLKAVHDGEIQRLQINMPPGMMKSTTCTVMMGPWEWGPLKKPWLRYLTTSYVANWAERDSRKHRDIVLSEWYQQLWPIELTRFSAENFENTFRGGRVAVPVKRLTGGRGNRLIYDDPHSVDGAESAHDRELTIRRFRESATSRLNDQERDAIIVMMHRLHPDDLCGEIERLDLPYTKLILPMEFVRSISVKTPWFTDPRKEEGELLFPKHVSTAKVGQLKKQSGEYAWDTQYQQLGRAREGATYFSKTDVLENRVTGRDVDGKDIVEYVPVPYPSRVDAVFAVGDTATKDGKKHDGTGVAWFAYVDGPIPRGYVLDWDLQQIKANLLIETMPQWLKHGESLARQCNATHGFKGIYIEDKDSGQVLIMQSQDKGYAVEGIPSESTALGKEGRAVSVGGYVRQNQLLFTETAYNKTLIYHERSRNHMLAQVTEYRIGRGTPHDEDELFDVFCYGGLLMFGDNLGR